MRRYSIITLLASAALIACSDRTDRSLVTTPSAPVFPPAVRNADVIGTLIENPDHSITPYPYALLDQNGVAWWLGGDQMAQLAAASGLNAQLDVRGSLDASNAILVESFVVLAVKGMAVSDGILEVSDSTYALRLSLGGELRSIIDPPDALKALVGDRVWVAGTDDASPIDFGLIAKDAEVQGPPSVDYRIRAMKPATRRTVKR